MKWIKASERLPEVEGEYFIIHVKGHKTSLYASGHGHQSRWKHEVLEWLDESPELKGKEDGWVKVKDAIGFPEWAHAKGYRIIYKAADGAWVWGHMKTAGAFTSAYVFEQYQSTYR